MALHRDAGRACREALRAAAEGSFCAAQADPL
jgi:hypothetical protein